MGRNSFNVYRMEYLRAYYEHCVVGGPDAFVIGVENITMFEAAIRRKLVREIAGCRSSRCRRPTSRRCPSHSTVERSEKHPADEGMLKSPTAFWLLR